MLVQYFDLRRLVQVGTLHLACGCPDSVSPQQRLQSAASYVMHSGSAFIQPTSVIALQGVGLGCWLHAELVSGSMQNSTGGTPRLLLMVEVSGCLLFSR